jgi:hypothetical protein
MFGTIRKHQTWLWALIITVIIISFVLFFSPYSKLNNSSRSSNLGTIAGQRLTTEDYFNAKREAELYYFFSRGGSWPAADAKERMGFDLERETYQWLLLVRKQEQLDIHISSEAVAQAARDVVSQFQKAGITSPTMFVQQVLRPHGLDVNDFERYMRHSLGLQELISTVALGGKLVTPQEAKSLYVREHEEVATEAVFFSGSNYLAEVTVTPEAIGNYYTNNQAKYRIPEQVQVNYVKVPISNFLAQAEEELTKTNLAQIVDENYQRLGTNHALIRDAKTPEEAKAKIREELIRGRALAEARKKGLEFARPLFDLDPKTANLQEQAKTNGLTVEVSAPFGPDGPKDMEVEQNFTKAAFTRTPDEPFAGPLMGKDGVYVISENKRIPSRIPPLEEIKNQVEADYKNGQGLTRARQAGQAFAQMATNGIAQGKTFNAVCAEAKVKPIELPPFSISTRNLPQAEEHIPLDQLKLLAFKTTPGKTSDFQPTAVGGLVLFVKAKLPLDDSKVNAELPSFTSYLRQNRQSEAFNDWFRKEAERGMRDTPLFRQQQQQQRPPPAARSAKS